ncbi:MAG TPA: hypothetical protein EYO75_08085 [Sulfurimonas sp.]|nr:hypothetical protein [Sulfurimonas sp.]HIM75098.1 hypothetical protein [Campylobacterales bacterium]
MPIASEHSRYEIVAILAGMLIVVPGFKTSHYLSSREIVTPLVLFSSTPAIFGFLKLNQMGASFSMVSNELVILLIQAIVYTILGYYFTNKKRKTICQNLKM